MTGGRWVSQPVPADGAISGEGVRNQLGRPDTDRLTVLVRESAQNSWDARDPDHDGPLRYSIDIRRLEASLAERWQKLMGEGETMPGVPIRDELEASDPVIIYVSDRGTTGLGGPTRADEPADSHDYVSFVLNVGDPRDTPMGGGTYGYGKATFFTTARPHAILVHSRCRHEGRVESRLIGIALGERHTVDETNYTGRHWWGIDTGDHVEPLRNEKADHIARQLGFPSFEADDLGTTIGVIAPELDERSPEEAGQWLAEAILWHLWPKLLTGTNGSPEMECRVTLDGEEITAPAPQDHPAIRLFARAMTELDAEPGAAEDVMSYRPRRHLGRLKILSTYEAPPALSEVGMEAGMDESVHHVCLLRAPRLVVDYRPGPHPLHEHVWYAGVFEADPEMDPIFAKSEPPTHDAWVPSQLTGAERTYVNVSLTRIDEFTQRFVAPREAEVDGPVVPLGAASRFFAGLLGDVTGDGADHTTTPGGTGSRRQVSLVGDPRWELLDEQAVLVQDVEVQASRKVTVEPKLGIAVWGGGGEPEASGESPRPRLVAWKAPSGEVHRDATMAFGPEDNGSWQMLVDPVPETVTSIALRTADRETEA